MKKFIYVSIALFSIFLVLAHEEDLDEAKKLIDSNINCDKLTDEQLEHIGDYYMEQMHPKEAHKVMDEMMGGEDSESLKQMHIAIARRIYCKDLDGMINYGMMGIMGQNMMGFGMMNNLGYNILFWLISIAVLIILILLIIWLYKKIKNK